LDCLEIVEIAPADYLGVYHTLKNDAFQLHLGLACTPKVEPLAMRVRGAEAPERLAA
jgi:hypothetical protein